MRATILSAWFAVMGLAVQAVSAGTTISVGDFMLLPDTPNQTVQVFVSGDDQVAALNLNAQIGDGSGSTGPVFTHADITTGTIFQNNNMGLIDAGSVPQLVMVSTLTVSGTVAASGLLVSLQVDTTGTFGGTYSFNLANTLNGSTDFGNITPTITDGSITIVPEPATLALMGLGGLVFVRRRYV